MSGGLKQIFKKAEFVIANPAHRAGLFIGFLLKDINCAAPAPHI
jgi:hypothetical protein